jgi:Na+/proline symporter
LTAGTLFASLFSGYTVIGVPNEAFKLGWLSIRWLPTLMAIVTGYFGTGLRLRKSSLLRNHQSPVDFITDRYQSQLLRYTVVFLQVLPTLIYLAAQVIAIKGTFNSIFELNPDSVYPVVIIMALILIFEWVGGLNSVALTDTIQALIMVLSFIIIPSVMVRNFGGWADLDPETYPKPEFYQTLSREQQWDFWQFSLINFSFFTLPHLLQRTYAARDLKSLKWGYAVMTAGPWFTSFVGIFMGTVGVAILVNEDGSPQSPSNPFAAILEEIMNLGGFAKGAGVIAVTASLAAIMSTADSLIIAISQLVTVEIIYPLRPTASPTEISWIGKGVSFMAVVVALLVG